MIWTRKRKRDILAAQKRRIEQHVVDAMVGAVSDVVWGFRSVDDAMDKYFDGMVWPNIELSPASEKIVRRLLVESQR